MTSKRKTILAGGTVAVLTAAALAGTAYARDGFGRGGMGMMPVVGEIVATVDANKDGSLSQEEINTSLTNRFTAADANADGNLSMDEFNVVWAEITRPASVRAFQFLDPNGDALVGKAELDERFGAVVQRFDRNGDDALSPEDRRGRGGRHGDRHGRGGWGWGGEGRGDAQ